MLVGLCLAGQPVRAGETIGSFDQVTGEVTVRDRGAKRFPASIGMPLENGYMVKTGQRRRDYADRRGAFQDCARIESRHG